MKPRPVEVFRVNPREFAYVVKVGRATKRCRGFATRTEAKRAAKAAMAEILKAP